MASDLQKYRAQIFQISGFGFMSPLGKIILDSKDIKFENLNLWLLVYFLFSLILTYFGMILILKVEEKLEEYKRRYYE